MAQRKRAADTAGDGGDAPASDGGLGSLENMLGDRGGVGDAQLAANQYPDAGARAANQEEQFEAQVAMREVLHDVLLGPSRRVKTGWFDDL